MNDVSNGQRALWMVLITSLAAPFFASLVCTGLALARPLTEFLMPEALTASLGEFAVGVFAWSALPSTVAALTPVTFCMPVNMPPLRERTTDASRLPCARPVLVAKLMHEPGEDCDHHRKDLDNLTRYCEKKWERDLTWQVMQLKGATIDDLNVAHLGADLDARRLR